MNFAWRGKQLWRRLMICPRCSKKAPDHARFCPRCGMALGPGAVRTDVRDDARARAHEPMGLQHHPFAFRVVGGPRLGCLVVPIVLILLLSLLRVGFCVIPF